MMTMTREAASQEAAHPDIPFTTSEDDQDNVFLLAFGPADHHFESDDGEEACSYVLGYN